MSECFQFKNIFFYYFPKIFAGKENGGGGSHPSIFTPDSHWTWPRLAAIKQIENNYMLIFFCLQLFHVENFFFGFNNCQSCKNVPTVLTSWCYFFQLVLIFGSFLVIFGPFWQFGVIFGPIWAILGHFWAILGNFR